MEGTFVTFSSFLKKNSLLIFIKIITKFCLKIYANVFATLKTIQCNLSCLSTKVKCE